MENSVSAFLLVKPQHKDGNIKKALMGIDQVAELQFVTGDIPYIAKVFTTDTNELGRIIGEIRSIEGVESTQTLVVLQTLKSPVHAYSTREPSQERSRDNQPPYTRFLKGLVEKGKGRSRLHENMRVNNKPFIRATGSILSGLYNYYYSGRTWGRVELYIDRGSRQENKDIFDTLYASKEAVEAKFGRPLNWARLEDKRACRISYRIETGGYNDADDQWGKIQDEMVTEMINLEAALRPYVAELKNAYS